MHLGKALNIPMVSIFSGDIHPLMRLNKFYHAIAIHHPQNVSAIPPDKISEALLMLSLKPKKRFVAQFIGKEPCCVLESDI
jgi:hypothetical protein